MEGAFFMSEHYFDYVNEPRQDILCIDLKSFYASCECVERGLNPLTTILVVMSNAENNGGLALATSPKAKSLLGISNVSRKYEIPNHKDLLIVPPRMNLYIKKNLIINAIYKQYVADEDILVYSIDETFVNVTKSKKLFGMSAYEFAVQFQRDIYHETGLICTVGIGDNPLLSKLALDNEAKKNKNMIATWRYEDVPTTVWKIKSLTDFWGINTRTEKRLKSKGIRTIEELAHYDYFQIKKSNGVIGEQLIAHAWGIDRTNLSDVYTPLSKSIGNSQILMRDYTNDQDIKLVLREIVEQVASRIRRKHLKTGCISVGIGYSRNEQVKGFNRQRAISPTNHSKTLVNDCFTLFDDYYTQGVAVRHISVSFSRLQEDSYSQFTLFEDPHQTLDKEKLDRAIDTIRGRYGFDSIVYASSHLEGATAIKRSHLVGGHAGGMDGLT